jgi:hypothetical protein
LLARHQAVDGFLARSFIGLVMQLARVGFQPAVSPCCGCSPRKYFTGPGGRHDRAARSLARHIFGRAFVHAIPSGLKRGTQRRALEHSVRGQMSLFRCLSNALIDLAQGKIGDLAADVAEGELPEFAAYPHRKCRRCNYL